MRWPATERRGGSRFHSFIAIVFACSHFWFMTSGIVLVHMFPQSIPVRVFACLGCLPAPVLYAHARAAARTGDWNALTARGYAAAALAFALSAAIVASWPALWDAVGFLLMARAR